MQVPFFKLERKKYRKSSKDGTTDSSTEHILMKLLELEGGTGMKLVKVAIRSSNDNKNVN